MSDLSDLVLQKIGRNVVDLSKIEGMLKLFLSRINFQSPVNKLAETLEERERKFATMTLGQISKEYFKTFNMNAEPIHQYPENIGKGWVSFSFDTECEASTLTKIQREFELMVAERNRLVHQMLIKFNPDSIESCNALITELDEQNTMIQVEYKNLQEKIKDFQESVKTQFDELRKNIGQPKQT